MWRRDEHCCAVQCRVGVGVLKRMTISCKLVFHPVGLYPDGLELLSQAGRGNDGGVHCRAVEKLTNQFGLHSRDPTFLRQGQSCAMGFEAYYSSVRLVLVLTCSMEGRSVGHVTYMSYTSAFVRQFV